MAKRDLFAGEQPVTLSQVNLSPPAFLSGENITLSLMDNLEVAVYTCNAQGYVSTYNRAAAKLWGRNPEIGKDLWCGSWKIYEPDGVTTLSLESCPMAMVLKGVEVANGKEIIIEKPDGERSYVMPFPRPLRDSKGKIKGAVNLLLDITRFKKLEQKQAHLAAIVQYSDDAIISKTLDGIIASWNEAAEKMFGYTADEMIGCSMLTIIPRERWDEEYYIQDQIRKGNKIDHYETKRIARDGKLLDVSLTISPVRDSSGTIIGASKIARDITDRKSNEKALRESEERLRLAVRTAKLGTWKMDPFSGEIECSVECRNILGFPESLELSLDLLLKQVYPKDMHILENVFARVYQVDMNPDFDIEHRIISYSDGRIKWIRVRCKMYFDNDGQPEKLIGTIMEITDEKERHRSLEEKVGKRTRELERLNAELQRSNRDLEQFAFVASHDLQEPLRKIQSLVSLIELKTENKEQFIPHFEKISQSASRMSELIADVLEYSRLGKSEALFGSVDLNGLIRQVLSDLESSITTSRAKIKIAPLPVVTGIQAQLHQLFANLISNSLKFSPASPEITLTRESVTSKEIKNLPALDPARTYIKLVLTDNGIGFDNQHAEKIFLLFQRLNGRSAYKGTGIGLALCKKIVENHGGHISASGEPGKGARFTVILPV